MSAIGIFILNLVRPYLFQIMLAGGLTVLAGGGFLGVRHHYIGIGYQRALDAVAAQDKEAIDAAAQARERVGACTRTDGVWDVTEGVCARE